MQIEFRRESACSIMTIPSKRLDYMNVNGFKNQMLDLISQGHNRVILDMANVESMDSKGLSAFLFLSRAVGPDGRVALVSVHEQVQKMLVLTRTDRILSVFNTLPEALAAIDQ